MLILGDSIPKYVSDIEGVTLQSFGGDTIAKLSHRIDTKQVSMENFDHVLIHVGTNDVDNLVNIEPKCKQKPFDIERAYDCMISDYGNLIGVIRKKKTKLSIILSAILPRPKDHMNTYPLIRKVNGYIEKQMAKTSQIRFLRSYKPFMFGGAVKRELFAKRDGGLHLNTEGTNKLRYFFLRSLASMY